VRGNKTYSKSNVNVLTADNRKYWWVDNLQ